MYTAKDHYWTVLEHKISTCPAIRKCLFCFMLFSWTDPLGQEIPPNQEKRNIIAAGLDVSLNGKTQFSIRLISGEIFKDTIVRKYGIKTPSHSLMYFSISKRNVDIKKKRTWCFLLYMLLYHSLVNRVWACSGNLLNLNQSYNVRLTVSSVIYVQFGLMWDSLSVSCCYGWL